MAVACGCHTARAEQGRWRWQRQLQHKPPKEIHKQGLWGRRREEHSLGQSQNPEMVNRSQLEFLTSRRFSEKDNTIFRRLQGQRCPALEMGCG
jgi:hypothetical protein